MVSRIERKVPNEFMFFKHLGFIDKDGKEDLESEKAKFWAGSMENSYLRAVDGKTELTVEMASPRNTGSIFPEPGQKYSNE